MAITSASTIPGRVVLTVLLAASSASADVWDAGPIINGNFYTDNTLIGTPNVLIHGTVQVHDLAALTTTEVCPTPPCPDRDWYMVLNHPYTSHEVLLEAATASASWEASGPAALFNPPVLSRHGQAGGVLQVGVPLGNSVVPSGTSSMRWETAGPGFPFADAIAVAQVAPPACGTACDANAQYTIRFYETTAFIPRFNNAGGQVTVLFLHNSVSADFGDGTAFVTGHINFYENLSGMPVQVVFTLNPNTSLALNTSTVMPGVGGRITVTHNGRYGQLVGKATAVEPATGFSFDTPLSYIPH
jgi:hypothetical protein